MSAEQAKEKLRNFFGGKVLTFSVFEYPNGEWVAECNEIPAITTGGVGDITERDQLMRDAIVTAAGVDSEYGSILEFKGYLPVGGLANLLRSNGPEAKAKYVVPA